MRGKKLKCSTSITLTKGKLNYASLRLKGEGFSFSTISQRKSSKRGEKGVCYASQGNQALRV